MTPSGDSAESFTEDFIIPIPSLAAGTPGIVYVSHTRTDPSTYALGSFSCALKFVSKEVDPESGEPEEDGYEDEYSLEDVEVSAGGDWIIPNYVAFNAEWERLASVEVVETFALGAMESIKGLSRSYIIVM